MFPIEGRVYTFKSYVRNRARPEASIAEAYLADEALTYCSTFLYGLEPRLDQEGRYDTTAGRFIFKLDVHLLGKISRGEISSLEYEQITWYVLSNAAEVDPFVE